MAVPPPSLTPAAPTKAQLRASLRRRRSAFLAGLDPEQRRVLLDALAHRVLPHVPPGAIVAGYVAIGAEIDPEALLLRLAEQDIALALPHVADRDAPMRFLQWQPGSPLVAGPLQLMQPMETQAVVEPDLVLTPLLGFDRAGGRLGQGAGYYDCAFAAHPAARRIGLAWSIQEVDALPIDPWDVPLHAVATEQEWIG
jgi:5-formyltetrahydrofolate cyclo-ligase